MRMAGPDVVLFIVGALLFGGALTAIIVTQGPSAFTGPAASATGVYTVTYTTATTQAAKAAVADFTSGSVPAKVNGTNIKSVKVSVECSDSPAGTAVPFAITLNVEGPGGLKGKPTTGNCGSAIVVEVPVQPVPPSTSVSGGSPEAAKANLPKNANETAGVGDWKITYTGARSSPAGGLPVPPPGTAPGGNIVVNVETYSPKLDPVQK